MPVYPPPGARGSRAYLYSPAFQPRRAAMPTAEPLRHDPQHDAHANLAGALTVLSQIPGPLTVEDSAGRLLFANDAAAKLCGFETADDMMASAVEGRLGRFEFYDDDGRSLPLAEFPGRRVLAGLDAPERLIRFRTPDGRERSAWVASRRLSGFEPPLAINLFRDATAVIEGQERLRDSERRLRLAIDAGRMGTWEQELPGGRVHWSPEIERLHAIPAGSFDGTLEAAWRDIHPDDRATVVSASADAIARRRDHKLLYRIVRPDGGVRWIESFATVVRDPSGEPARLVGVASDVTDRVDAEEAHSALRIQRMLEGINDAFSVFDRSWQVVFANQASTAPLGLDPADVIGKNIWQLVPAAIGTKFHTELVRVLETGEATTFEEHYPPFAKWFEVHAYPVPGVGVAVYSRDVTGRRSEHALQQRLALYGELRSDIGAALSRQDHVPAMLQRCCDAIVSRLRVSFARVWLVDATGEVLELQASAGKYTHIDGGHARVKVGALKIGLIASEREPHLTNDVLHDSRVGDPAWAKREGMVAFAGYPLVVSDRVVGVMATFATEPLPDDTLVALGSIGDAIAQGVERRRAEIALEEHARDLARSNAELEQFAYVASHDLQEPLRMVASYVQLLERRYRDQLDQNAREFIGFAVEGATRMRRLIEDLLAYSRVGTRGRDAAPVEIDDVIATVENNLQQAIVESGAVITRDPLPNVTADDGQLVQLYQNLIGNAIKFRSDEAPRIHLGAWRDGADWILSVADNGIGIDPQYFDRIFVIFQRLNARERYPGTGIGLAIAKKIVERHGGRIWVESTPGRGSTILFALPVAPRAKLVTA
jgi:PAS domain S-box-containing protein